MGNVNDLELPLMKHDIYSLSIDPQRIWCTPYPIIIEIKSQFIWSGNDYIINYEKPNQLCSFDNDMIHFT